MALMTVAELQDMLGVTGDEPRLTALLAAAERWVLDYCGREFERKERTEFYSGTATHFLVLRQRPVVLVSEVLVASHGWYGQGDGFAEAVPLVPGVDFALRLDSDSAGYSESGVLCRLGTTWPHLDRTRTAGLVTLESAPVFGNIRVRYTAGFDSVPAGLKLALAALVSHFRRVLPYGGALVREKLGRWEYELQPLLPPARPGSSVPGDVHVWLGPYREVSFGGHP